MSGSPDSLPVPGKRSSPRRALTLIELFEATVLEVSWSDGFAEARAVRELVGMLREAAALVSGLAPELVVGLPLGRLAGDYTALAWCISHYDDMHYRAARAAAGPPSRPADGYQHPLDHFTRVLGMNLRKLMRAGRAGRYRVHGWLGKEPVDLEPGWFVDGNIVALDALANAIEMANGCYFTGIEAWLTDADDGAGPAAEKVETEEAEADVAELDAAEPSEVEKWMRLEEAKALVVGQPPLKMVATRDACVAHFAARGITVTRAEAEKAFKKAVWTDRRRRSGGRQK
jgi:hypothetical protein